jgi:type IV secretory pathway TraG/TraD family ATPase VirD4
MKRMNEQLLLTFGGRAITYDGATAHSAFVGATGSGKSLSIRLLLESILGIATNHKVPTRMLVYDSKHEFLPVLYGMFDQLGRTDADEKITLLNPFDKRSASWDICRDIRRPAHATELAAMLLSHHHGGSAGAEFWINSARTVIKSVVESFIAYRRPWDLRDLCLALQTETAVRSVVGRTSRTAWIIDDLLGEPRTAKGIMSTIAAEIGPFRDIATMWQSAKRKIGLRQWLKSGDGLLVLGTSKTAQTAVNAINRLLFERLSQLILEEEPEIKRGDPRRIWIVLDEFVRAGRLPGAVELATEGRSKGVALVLGFQDIDGLRAIYGREVAHEILGQCSNLALLRMNSVETAEWASDVVGEYRSRDRRYSATEGASISRDVSLQTGQSADVMLTDRRIILPSYFQRIEPVSKGNGISGVFLSPYWYEGQHEASQHTIESDWLFEEGYLWPASKHVSGYEYIDVPEWGDVDDDYIDEHLREWDTNDYKRLGIPQTK